MGFEGPFLIVIDIRVAIPRQNSEVVLDLSDFTQVVHKFLSAPFDEGYLTPCQFRPKVSSPSDRTFPLPSFPDNVVAFYFFDPHVFESKWPCSPSFFKRQVKANWGMVRACE